MPRPIRVAIACVAVMILCQAVLLLDEAAHLGSLGLEKVWTPLLGVLLLVGIVRGHRLAWQWGRIIGMVGMVGSVLVGTLAATGAVSVLLFFQALAMLGLFLTISTPDARGYFRLICPDCGATPPNGGDFFFNVAECRKCGTKW